jgi:carbon-monoxide dehydrogenase small subunit
MKIELSVNGREVSLDTDPRRRLLDVLREDLGLTGVKEGCGEGECGACAVLMGDRLVNSCLLPVGYAAESGEEILTIEGYRSQRPERFAVLEAAFREAGAVQCGFCTPGFMMAAESLLAANPDPTEEEIREALSGNLCRCTGYQMIVEGVRLAAGKGAGLW